MIDTNKLIHWLNIRKTTFDVLNDKISRFSNLRINRNNLSELDRNSVEKISELLEIPTNYILKTVKYLTLYLGVKKN